MENCRASGIEPDGEEGGHGISALVSELSGVSRHGYGVQSDNGKEKTVIRPSGVLDLHPIGQRAEVVP
jgi:hypothetical protein